MRQLSACMLVLAAACGRLDFGAHVSGDGGNGGDGGDDGDAASASNDGSAAASCLASYLLCDGFETAALASTWTVSPSGVSVDSTVAHRGTQSLHVHTDQ